MVVFLLQAGGYVEDGAVQVAGTGVPYYISIISMVGIFYKTLETHRMNHKDHCQFVSLNNFSAQHSAS
jgi:hypothetical protein